MKKFRSRSIIAVCALLLASNANTEERAVDALLAELESKAALCETLGADDCARQCRSAINGINQRIVSSGLDSDDRTRPAIDHRYVNPCNTLFDAAESALTAPSMPDVEGTFDRAGARGIYTVRADGRDSDWVEICHGAARIKDPGGLARQPPGIRVRLVNITYDPERVGQQLTPCTADGVDILD